MYLSGYLAIPASVMLFTSSVGSTTEMYKNRLPADHVLHCRVTKSKVRLVSSHFRQNHAVMPGNLETRVSRGERTVTRNWPGGATSGSTTEATDLEITQHYRVDLSEISAD